MNTTDWMGIETAWRHALVDPALARSAEGETTPEAEWAAYWAAVAWGRSRLFGVSLGDWDGVLALPLARAATRRLHAALGELRKRADNLFTFWTEADNDIEAREECLSLLEGRMDAWAVFVSLDEAQLDALVHSLLGRSELAAECRQAQSELALTDEALLRQQDLLSVAAGTELLANWRHLIVEPYRLFWPWWLDGSLEELARRLWKSLTFEMLQRVEMPTPTKMPVTDLPSEIKCACTNLKCGASLRIKSHLAGKLVKCPRCQQPLRVPGKQLTSVPRPESAPVVGPLDAIAARVQSMEAWLGRVRPELDATRNKSDEWADTLLRLRQDLKSTEEVVIAVLGTAGAGKSTLINAVIGHRILPTDDSKICTAAVTNLRNQPGEAFQAVVHFLSFEEWDSEIKAVCELEAAKTDESTSPPRALLVHKLMPVYGLNAEQAASVDLQMLELPDDIRAYLDARTYSIRETDPKELGKKLQNFLSTDGRLWPLIQRVDISGPFLALPPGVALVDLPGTNDPNKAREDVTRKYLDTAPFIWLAVKRGFSKDVRDLLEKQHLLRQLLMDGRVNALTGVATKIDDVKLPEDVTEIDVIREKAVQSKDLFRTELLEVGNRMAERAGASEADRARLRAALEKVQILPVSAAAYLKIRQRGDRREYYITDEKDTGIPALAAHLQEICKEGNFDALARRAQGQLDELKKQADNHLALEILTLEAHAPNLLASFGKLETEVRPHLERLKNDFDAVRAKMSRTFDGLRGEFVDQLEGAATESGSQIGAGLLGWLHAGGRIHGNTLNAVLRKDGGPHTDSNHRTWDINQEMANPLIQRIPFNYDAFFSCNFPETLFSLGEGWRVALSCYFDNFRTVVQTLSDRDDPIFRKIEEAASLTESDVLTQVKRATDKVVRNIGLKRAELCQRIPDAVRRQMRPRYQTALSWDGKSCFPTLTDRRIDYLAKEAETCAQTFFSEATQELEQEVVKLWSKVLDEFETVRDGVSKRVESLIEDLKALQGLKHHKDTRERISRLEALRKELAAI